MPIKFEEVVQDIRKEFKERISKKTGWGKNEILQTLDEAIAIALAKNIDTY